MKKSYLAAALSSMFLLSACNSLDGKNFASVTGWVQDKPSVSMVNTDSQAIASAEVRKTQAITPPGVVAAADDPVMPTLQDATPIVTEPVAAPAAAVSLTPPQIVSAPRRHKLAWQSLDDYDAARPSLPGRSDSAPLAPKLQAPPPSAVKYNDSVQYFPLDGDTSPYANRDGSTAMNGSDGDGNQAYAPVSASDVSGQLAQSVYFAHGSSSVNKMDRKNLHELAASLVKNNGYRVNIVGHASKRVNTTRDPIARKMINFRMAQKRANAVAQEMKKAGLAPSLVVATSAGDEQPAVRPRRMSQEAADRRADLFVNAD